MYSRTNENWGITSLNGAGPVTASPGKGSLSAVSSTRNPAKGGRTRNWEAPCKLAAPGTTLKNRSLCQHRLYPTSSVLSIFLVYITLWAM
jgi:hypothetical protein